MKYLLPAVVALGVGAALPNAALADETVQSSRPVYGCVDPRATIALAIPDGRMRNRKWVEYVHRTGQCAPIPTGRPLTVLAHQGALLLVKSPDAPDSSLPVYVQSGDMSAASAPATPPAAQAAPPAAVAEPPAEIPAAPAPSPAALQPAASAPSSAQDATQAPVGSPQNTAPNASPNAVPAATPAVPPVAALAVPPAQSPQDAGPATADAAPPVGNNAANVPPATTAPPPAAIETPAPVTSPPPAPVVPPVAAPAVEAQHGSSGIVWLLLILGLALLALVGAAVLISRQQRRFAHVEGANWPEEDDGRHPVSGPSPVAQAVQPEPSPQSFRKSCVEVLERGGWTIQPTFAAGAAREGAPDILGRRHDAVLAVRCRGGSATVTPEIVDEVAAMGQSARAHVIVLATPAPLTRRAHDEAVRLHVHVLDQDELASLSA